MFVSKKVIIPVFFLISLGLILGTTFNQNASALAAGVNTLVSVNNTGDGQGGNGKSPFNSVVGNISADGRYAVFNSVASNLVASDTNGYSDIFVRDLVNGVTSRVNVSTLGAQSNGAINNYGDSQEAISSTGRYVVFASLASNLIDGQTITGVQVYIRDTVTNTTSLVTKKADGTLSDGKITGVSGVSNDGRFVTWKTWTKSSLDQSGISTIGTHIYVTDLYTNSLTLLNSPPTSLPGATADARMSCDGSFYVFYTNEQIDVNDTDTSHDVYLVDIRNGFKRTSITSISNTSGKNSLSPEISCNGNYITFKSDDSAFSSLVSSTSTIYHTYVYDRISGVITIADTSSASVLANGNGSTDLSGVDDKGNVIFRTNATNLVSGVTTTTPKIYLKHKDTGITELITRTPGGAPSSTVSGNATISSDGKYIVYGVGSAATTLLSSDTNGKEDIILSETGL